MATYLPIYSLRVLPAHVALEEVAHAEALARVVHRILPLERRLAVGPAQRRRPRARDDAGRVRVRTRVRVRG